MDSPVSLKQVPSAYRARRRPVALLCAAALLACLSIAAPESAFATYADFDVDNAAAQEIGSYGDPIYASEIPDGTYEIPARTSSYMCIMYRTYDDAKDKVSKEKCYIKVENGAMTAFFYISNMYTRLCLGVTGEEAAALTNEDGTDDSAYIVGDPADGYVPHYFSMDIPALNYPMKFAAFAGGNYPYSDNPKSSWYSRAKWYSRTVVFLSSESVLDAIEAAKSSSSSSSSSGGSESGDDPKDEPSSSSSSSSSGGGDEPGGDDPGGDTPGGDDPGGDDPGSDTPGGDDPGDTPGGDDPGDTPGGDDPGDTPGGDDPGGDDPGSDTPGGDDPGSDTPGDDEPGGDPSGPSDTPGGGDPGDDTPGDDIPGGDPGGGEPGGGDDPGSDTPGASSSTGESGGSTPAGDGKDGGDGKGGKGGGERDKNDGQPGGVAAGADSAGGGSAGGGSSQLGPDATGGPGASAAQDPSAPGGQGSGSQAEAGSAGGGSASKAMRGKALSPSALDLPDDVQAGHSNVEAVEMATERGTGLGLEGSLALAVSGLAACGLAARFVLFALARRLPTAVPAIEP